MSIKAIQAWMIEHEKTLGCAESCTGGYLSMLFTQLPGASNYFLGSFVTYSNKLKKTVLKVRAKTLKVYGAVSPETAREMWEGALKRSGADCAIAVTGIAGPGGGSLSTPVGTVYYVFGFKGQKLSEGKMLIKGSRKVVIDKASRTLLLKIKQKYKINN
jgi:PncC family amidohydrolase